MQEKVSNMSVWCRQRNPSLGITVRHHSASLVMPISDPRDRFFYPHRTPMKDTYYLRLFILDSALLELQWLVQFLRDPFFELLSETIYPTNLKLVTVPHFSRFTLVSLCQWHFLSSVWPLQHLSQFRILCKLCQDFRLGLLVSTLPHVSASVSSANRKLVIVLPPMLTFRQ